MKVEIAAGQVVLKDGDATGDRTRSMSFDQYAKHMRDPEFAAAVSAADDAKVRKAIADALADAVKAAGA